eukprot:1428726-Pleurochrysis_carterae.AAC.2
MHAPSHLSCTPPPTPSLFYPAFGRLPAPNLVLVCLNYSRLSSCLLDRLSLITPFPLPLPHSSSRRSPSLLLASISLTPHCVDLWHAPLCVSLFLALCLLLTGCLSPASLPAYLPICLPDRRKRSSSSVEARFRPQHISCQHAELIKFSRSSSLSC